MKFKWYGYGSNMYSILLVLGNIINNCNIYVIISWVFFIVNILVLIF